MENEISSINMQGGHTESVPKVMRVIFLHSTEGPGKESGGGGGQGRWRGNPGIQFDLPHLSLRLCSSQYVSKVHCSFCHWLKCRGVWSSIKQSSSA
jgi:hypothetical protein